MLKAIKDLLNDENFHDPLEPAVTACKQATCVTNGPLKIDLQCTRGICYKDVLT